MKIYIRTTQAEGSAKIYIQPRIDGKSFFLSTGLDVPLKEWWKTGSFEELKFIQSETKAANLMRRLGHEKKLQDIENGLKDLREKNGLTVDAAKKLIETIVLADVRAEQEKQRERMQKAVDAQRKDVKLYVDNFIANLGKEDGTRTANGEAYTTNSIKNLKQFHRIFSAFYRKNKVATWDDIDKKYVEKFFACLDKQYMRSSLVRFVSIFRTIMGRAFDDGARTKPIPSNMFYRPVVKEQDKAAEIYLTNEELDAFYGMQLQGSKEIVRDLFLIGCFTGQRFSDYSKIDKSCVGETAKGTKVLRLVQKKTQKKVAIPITDDRLLTLLEKYDYTVPDVVDVVFNRYIKQIGKKLAESVQSLGVDVATSLTKTGREAEEAGRMEFRRDGQGRVIKYRWQLITSHTARRTCITLMHLSGKYTIPQMMSVSGHTKTETFFKYLKQSLDDDADSVAMAAGEDGLF